MTRETQQLIKNAKQNAIKLVQYANPNSKTKPSFEQVAEILLQNIPYKTTRPAMT